MKILELAERIGARVGTGVASRDVEVSRGAGLDTATSGEVSFFADLRYRSEAASTRASAVIVDEALASDLEGAPFVLLLHPRPAAAFAMALEALHPEHRPPAGIHESAVVERGARVHESAFVGPLAHVGEGASIGARARLSAGSHVGAGAVVGEDCVLGARSVVEFGCVLGARVRLQAGAIVGSDGFGYTMDEDGEGRPFHRKIPQVGTVRIEDDVEVGAGACIDRATTGETVIGRGTKIDNLVQVGHNSRVGPLCILCGQVGLAGSSRLGAGVVLGGQVGVAGHLTVGDGARVGAQSGIGGDVGPGEVVSGSPAIPHRAWLRAALAFKELPGLLKRVRRLEKLLKED